MRTLFGWTSYPPAVFNETGTPDLMRGLPGKFIDFNKYLSERFDEMLPEEFRVDGQTHFRKKFAPSHISKGALVYDVGGGKHPLHSREEKARRGLRVVGLDIDEGELLRAPCGVYDETIRADITRYRGREDADVVICQALLEHVADTPAAFAGLASILQKGGVALLFTPSKNSLYARVNLLLPESFKRKLLRFLYPELTDKSGFPGRYHRCTLSDFEDMACGQGFAVIRKKAYFCSGYFSFFAPLHVLWRVWLWVFYLLSRERAAETFSMALRKK
ncbi:MAG: methyltransferase domain-containing protein [Nitrospinae bacterium]|nr:methyltransferase domain-containing protein [Nitrospinota bacterium]